MAILGSDLMFLISFDFMFAHLAFITFFSVFSFAVIRLVSRYAQLKNIPGPWWAPFTRLWLLAALASENAATRYAQVNIEFGPLARIGPNHLITSDPETIRKMLAVRSKYRRGPWYDFLRLDPHRTTLVTERDSRKHNVLRHQMSAGYAGNEIDNFESVVEECIQEWISYIDKFGTSDTSRTTKFDIARSIQYLTTDIISYLCFGEAFGFVRKHEDVHGFISMVESRLPIVEKFSVLVELNSLLSAITRISWLRRALLPQPGDKSGLGKIIGISQKVVNDRLRPDSMPRNDMLDSFLKHGMRREQIESEMTIALFAGSDTTATAMRATILHIISNPMIYQKVKQEISSASVSAKISRPVKGDEAARLPYLQACIKESLRIFPPITAPREHVTPPGGDILLGHFIPGGVNVGINMVGMLRSHAFNPDADIYRPERWLGQTPEKLATMERVHELVFGHGSTRCLGTRIAGMVLSKALVELFRHFDLAVVNPTSPWQSRCHGIFFQEKFWLRITRDTF